jgi:hypothetical protein
MIVACNCACSLADNNLTNYGRDMSAVIKLAEVIPSTQILSLK